MTWITLPPWCKNMALKPSHTRITLKILSCHPHSQQHALLVVRVIHNEQCMQHCQHVGHRDILCNVVSICTKRIYCIRQYADLRFYKVVHLWHINGDVNIMYFNAWSCDVDLHFLENNCRYGYSQVSLEYLWTATRILERNSNPGEGEACKATGV
jgi:hypothetical protein